MTVTGRSEVATLIERTLAGGPRVLHIGLAESTVPTRLAQEHDREVECLRWPSATEPDPQWGLDVGASLAADHWAQPFLAAPVDVVVIEGVLDARHDPDQFFRTLATGVLVPGGLVVVAGRRDLTGPSTAAGFVVESETAATADSGQVTVARFPSFTTARPASPEADEASAAENRRLAHELERTRELLARERATIAREMQAGKDELLALDRQLGELQERLQRLRHKNVLLRARVAQVSRERDLVQSQVAELEEELFLARDSRAVRAVASVVQRARRRRDGS